MSLETQALQALNDAEAAFTGKVAEIDAAVLAALQTVPAQARSYTVDQAAGSDANDGTVANPLATFKEAVNRTPAGGILYCTVVGDYHFTDVTALKNITFELRGQGASRLTFGWVMSTNDPTKINRLAGFEIRYGAEVNFNSLDIELPADPAQTFEFTHMRSIFSGSQALFTPVVAAKFTYCDFYHNAGAAAAIFGAFNSMIFARFPACTFQADYEGKIQQFQGGTGVDPATLRHIINTDLTFI